MSDVTIPQYLLARLEQIGVGAVFGVPGDYNLTFLDYIDDNPNLNWVGSVNELNAAYAADGYARVKNNLGVLVTTFGVGELSAVNGVAGAFSERVPLLHVVGVPSTQLQSREAILHHTLGDGRFDAFIGIYSHVSTASVFITSPDGRMTGRSAGEQIDLAITTALTTCRPTYLTIPTDLVDEKIPFGNLSKKLSWEYSSAEPQAEDVIVQRAVEMAKKAKHPIILIDACAIRFGIQDLCVDLVNRTGLTFFTSPMGKGAIREDHPHYGGVYAGSISEDSVRQAVETSDLMISIGALKSDFNTGSFTYHTSSAQTIELHSNFTQIEYAHYQRAGFKSILPKLIKALEPLKDKKEKFQLPPRPKNTAKASGTVIKQDEFWQTWQGFFREKDIILAETGTSSFGLLDVQFPPEAIWISQILWGSIGYTAGAAFGAAMAAKEEGLGRRTLLFIGDGSLQLTVQELSSIIRHKLPVTIIVLNNSGYTIERKIHGETREYNDIKSWNWQNLLDVFNPDPGTTASYKVSTPSELEALQQDKEFCNSKKVQLVEVIMDKQDSPRALAEMTRAKQ